MNAVASGYLDDNIAFHLALDVGNFYASDCVNSMRYNENSIQFWLTVSKLFKGRGTNFFRGFKGEGLRAGGAIKPSDCRINFAVPCDKTIRCATYDYRLDVAEPGVITSTLDAYAEAYKDSDVKLSIDGKKLAYGLGNSGEENLCGFESAPTLSDRQARHTEELQTLGSCGISNIRENTDTDTVDRGTAKAALLISIKHLSLRVQELRQLIVKRKLTVSKLLERVEGDWKTSSYAPSISYWQTKIYLSNQAINDLLESIDNLGHCVAQMNGQGDNYIPRKGTPVTLNEQSNYLCLKTLPRDAYGDLKANSAMIKQRTETWHELRDGASVTGSTMFRGLGFATLKQQREHIKSTCSIEKLAVSPELEARFQYGTENEIHALATTVAKYLPVFYPNLRFLEDGCSVLSLGGSNYAVISGDGNGIDASGVCEISFEFKCPIPDKMFRTDVHYELPLYYTTQVLAEMAASRCDRLAFVSYTPESTTFIMLNMDGVLYNKLWSLACETYGQGTPSLPTRKNPEANSLLPLLKNYAQTGVFVAEFPSLSGIPCQCREATSLDDIHGTHMSAKGAVVVQNDLNAHTMSTTLDAASKAVSDAYQLLRRPAKEVLVTVVSDLERQSDHTSTFGHAVPIQYGLSGFSLPMITARNFLCEAVKACLDKDLKVKAIAFDGQFLELSTKDGNGKPLTIQALHTHFWNEVKKLSKESKLKSLLQMFKLPNTDDGHLIDNFKLVRKQSVVEVELKKKPPVITNPCNITKVSKQKANANPETKVQSADSVLPESGPDIYEEALIALIASSPEQEESKWSGMSLEEFRTTLENATSIQKSYTVRELKTILSIASNDELCCNRSTKPVLVNLASKLYGDGSILPGQLRSPKTLKAITEGHIRSWNVDAINVAYAQIYFPDVYHAWDTSNLFNGEWIIETDAGLSLTIKQWYAQPTEIVGNVVQPIIDPHHLFVNNRVRCCSVGMEKMNIMPNAWWDVALDCRYNGTGLSMGIAKELRDRQSNMFAQTTFSEQVEMFMKRDGHDAEAEWCALIRNWYRAVDEGGLSINQRVLYMMKMRQKLLSYFRFGQFPPHSSSVADLPITQFEGILGNIDRRLQLYAITSKCAYNQRAVSTLDSENIFGAFQVNISQYNFLFLMQLNYGIHQKGTTMITHLADTWRNKNGGRVQTSSATMKQCIQVWNRLVNGYLCPYPENFSSIHPSVTP